MTRAFLADRGRTEQARVLEIETLLRPASPRRGFCEKLGWQFGSDSADDPHSAAILRLHLF